MPDNKAAIEELTAILHEGEVLMVSPAPGTWSQVAMLYSAAIGRWAPPGSEYVKHSDRILNSSSVLHIDVRTRGATVSGLRGIVATLRTDYYHGRMQTFRERVHSDVFSDFLEMAEYLLSDEGLKDPAAVLAGGVLEEHLRKLCEKHGVALSGQPKLDRMNSELVKADAYGKNDQKSVTTWAAFRNDAAHARYANYGVEQIRLMIQGIRDFIARVPA